MGHWTKYFIDQKTERGTDQDIQRGLASWSRGRLYGIRAVELEGSNYQLGIYGTGDYWQSDTYNVSMAEGVSVLTHRRIEKQIEPGDLFFAHCILTEKKHQIWFSNQLGHPNCKKQIQVLPSSYIGKWLILELDVGNQSTRRYFSQERI